MVDEAIEALAAQLECQYADLLPLFSDREMLEGILTDMDLLESEDEFSGSDRLRTWANDVRKMIATHLGKAS